MSAKQHLRDKISRVFDQARKPVKGSRSVFTHDPHFVGQSSPAVRAPLAMRMLASV
jgi:hypothetical protein